MSYIDELASDEENTPVIDAALVQRRVDDWIRRLTRLYRDISSWAEQSGWTHAEGSPVLMDGELMQIAGIPPLEQPGLVLISPKGERIWVKPKSLWVIGANGRVDIYTPTALLLLIDIAQQFDPAHWVMHHLPSKPSGGQDFLPAMLGQLD